MDFAIVLIAGLGASLTLLPEGGRLESRYRPEEGKARDEPVTRSVRTTLVRKCPTILR